MLTVLLGKEPKGVSNFLRREESSKEASTLSKASPYMEPTEKVASFRA